MTLGTVVIETGTDGGAMITAGLAADQGREVFAVPSAAGGRRPSGTNLLIKEGKAKLTESVDDILVELAPRLRAIPPAGRRAACRTRPDLTLFEQQLVDVLGNDPVHIDTLAARTGFTVSDALVHLLSLEFKGAGQATPGEGLRPALTAFFLVAEIAILSHVDRGAWMHMFVIGEAVIEDAVGGASFCCDLQACKGACCTLPGGRGAPLEDDEVLEIAKAYPAARQFLTDRSIRAVETSGYAEGSPGRLRHAVSSMNASACSSSSKTASPSAASNARSSGG